MKLAIDIATTDHRPGDTVRGSVAVADGREVRALRARLVLRERSDPYAATGWETEWVTLAGPGEPPPEAAFALQLPATAVPNPDGVDGPVRWEVEMLADRSRRFDVRERAPISVVGDGNVQSPQSGEEAEGRKRPRQSRAKAIRPGKLWAVAALVLVALGIPLAVLGLLVVGETIGSQDPQEGWALVLVGGICVAIAPPIWLVAVWRVAVPRARDIELRIEPQRARRGSTVRVDLRGSDGRALRAGPVVALELIELRDVDREVAGQETRVTVESSRWRREAVLDQGDAAATVVEFEVPPSEPFSYAGSCRSYHWRIVAREARPAPGRRHPPEIEQPIWIDP